MKRTFRVLSVCLVLLLVMTSCMSEDSDPTSTPAPEPTATSAAESPTETPVTEPTATPEPEPTQTPQASGPVTIDALWFAMDATQVYGGTSRVRVTVRPNTSPDGEIRVGFFESEVAGSGPQWNAAGWMAVITASLLLGEDPSQYEFSFDVAGRIDGPSAGALMTAAVLAGYLGHEINPEITMTGTINPDGSIGPVGGIPHKIAGAAQADKRIVLVPSGQRFDYDYSQGQSVDLVQTGQQHGVEVRLVPDINTVYNILTGENLPVIESQGTAQMPPGAFDKMRAAATNWQARYQSERARFFALPADVQEYRIGAIDIADFWASESNRLLGEGQVSNSYRYAWWSAAQARFATQAAELDNLYFTGGIDAMISRLQSTQAAITRMSAIRQRIEAEQTRTASDAIAVMDAASNLSIAQGLIWEAEDALLQLNQSDFTEDDILTAIYQAAFNYAFADIYLDLAEDGLTIGTGFGSSPAPSPEVLAAMAATLRRGAEANINYFEAIIITPWAQENGISTDLARLYIMEADGDYLTAVAALAGAQGLVAQTGQPEAQSSIWLGASMTAYIASSALIAKYYSLDAQVDEWGYIVGFDRSTGLADMLDLADQRSRQSMNGVSSEDPVSPLYYYENARIMRQGDAADQLDALRNYWQSAVLSKVLTIFVAEDE